MLIGVLGCSRVHIHIYALTHTYTGKGHQVPPCLWGTTSLSHSPWMCSCVQGFSNLDRSQSISLHLSLPDLSVDMQTANWQLQGHGIGSWLKVCEGMVQWGCFYLVFFCLMAGNPSLWHSRKNRAMGLSVEATAVPILFSHPHMGLQAQTVNIAARARSYQRRM